jgi:hypothetical protein
MPASYARLTLIRSDPFDHDPVHRIGLEMQGLLVDKLTRGLTGKMLVLLRRPERVRREGRRMRSLMTGTPSGRRAQFRRLRRAPCRCFLLLAAQSAAHRQLGSHDDIIRRHRGRRRQGPPISCGIHLQ